jgi:hypothetical protein
MSRDRYMTTAAAESAHLSQAIGTNYSMRSEGGELRRLRDALPRPTR